MVWKDKHGAVGCNRCAWFFTDEMKKRHPSSLLKVFEEHSCEKHPLDDFVSDE
jgi:hypothetical protein